MAVPSRPRDCVVMFTHQWNPSLARHYERLQREAGAVLPVFLAAHVEGRPLAGAPVDITVSLADAARQWPTRHAAWRRENRDNPFTYIDMLWLSAFRHPRLAGFDRFWLLEYDVDFSGNWARLFAPAAAYDADLLVSHLRRRDDEQRWDHLPGIVDPGNDPASQVIGLFSISRLSRRLIDHWHRELATPGWAGHFELVLPTIAIRGGFRVEDLGGDGRFTPPERRNRHYEGSFEGLIRGFYTHAAQPARLWHYYTESRLGYFRRDLIYHPVKIGGTPAERWGSRLMMVRDRLRAAIAHARGRQPTRKARRKR